MPASEDELRDLLEDTNVKTVHSTTVHFGAFPD
jgi:hypothetical protein